MIPAVVIAVVVFVAWASVVTLAWALVHGAELIERQHRAERTHHRENGPVRIDPDVKETIHVTGDTK